MELQETKPWYLSKTVWASLATVSASMLGLLKVSVTPDVVDDVADWAVAAATLAGGAVAMYGRLNATRRIGPRGRSSDGTAPPLPLGIGLALAVASAGGCAAPDAAFVRAERATHQAVAPEYVRYVRADPALSPEQRARRERTVRTWDLSIRQHEQRAEPAQAQPEVMP